MLFFGADIFQNKVVLTLLLEGIYNVTPRTNRYLCMKLVLGLELSKCLKVKYLDKLKKSK